MNAMNGSGTETNAKESWDGRTRLVVYGQVFLFLVAWGMALGRLIGSKFWDRQYNIDQNEALLADENIPKMVKHSINGITKTYYTYTRRFIWFFPHVAGSVIWWNLYFLQLVPSIRQKYKKFHRVLGRVLMVCALAQTISGVGLASTSSSSTIKIVSYLLALPVAYCVFNAWYFAAIAKDIPKHKYWSMRLVGYLQSIALQRVFMVVLICCHRFDWFGIYPPFDEDDLPTFSKVFDDSFVCCTITAMLLTEWYLSSYYGWTETSKGKTA
eukprot:jgi/Psemu1/309759/fgenesh1_kg.554_\